MQHDHVRIYQIFYSPDQRRSLDPAFIPYDNSDCPRPDEHEFYVFRKEYLTGNTQNGWRGFLSWKFQEKTGISGSEFLRFCVENPGHDVYFINPFPIEICFGSIWEQGEMWAPGISKIAQELLDRCGYTVCLASMPRRLRTLAYCNYWVGSPRFWNKYMNFCLPLYDYLQANTNTPLVNTMLGMADPSRNASYFAFIFERLFTTLLASDAGISFAAYQFTRQELCRRYPRCYADFIADLQEIEERFPDDPQPLLRSPKLLSFLDRQNRLAWMVNRSRCRNFFNQGWRRWSSSGIRQRILHYPALRLKEMELFFLLNPAYVHWRRDLPGRN